MKLTKIEVGRLPGVKPNQRLVVDAFDPETTVIVGPNASGKSSLVRALHAVLRPESIRDGLVDVAAEFREGPTVWRAQRIGNDVHWMRDGRPSNPPILPTEAHLKGVTLRLEDLVESGGSDAEIAQRIARELSGGFDLDAVRSRPPFSVRARHGSNERKRVEEAERKLSAARLAAERMASRERERDAWKGQLAVARETAAMLEPLDTAKRLIDARGRFREIEREVRTFPPGMEGLTDGAIEDRKRQRMRRQELDDRRAEATTVRDRAEVVLAGVPMGVRPPEPADLKGLEAQIDELRERESTVRQAQLDVDAADRSVRQAIRDLGGETPDAEINLTGDVLERVEDELVAQRELNAEVSDVAARMRMLEHSLEAVGLAGDAGPEEVRKGLERRREVRAAMLALQQSVTTFRFPRWPGWLLAAGGVGLGVWNMVLQEASYPSIPSFILLAVGLLWALWPGGQRSRPSALNKEVERVATRAGVSVPSTWEPSILQDWLDAFDDELARWTAALRDATERVTRADEAAVLEVRLEEARERREAIAKEIGFDVDAIDMQFQRWLKRVQDWDDAREDKAEAVARLDLEERAAKELGVRISKTLHGWSGSERPADENTDAVWLAARLDDVRDTLTRRIAAQGERSSATRELELVARAFEELEQEERAWRLRLEIAATQDPDEELERRVLQRDAWAEVRERLESVRADVRSAERLLDGAPSVREIADTGDHQKVEDAIVEAQRARGEIEELQTAIANVDAAVHAAAEGDAFARSASELREAHSGLRDARDQALFAALSEFLFDDVNEAFEASVRPRMLEEAEAAFANFTNHAYSLAFERVRDGEARFVAKEAKSGEVRSFDALSTGTRMQALVAVRMAFAREMERGGPSLPIVLDEALTTSDPERFSAVAKALARVARDEGRQVLYLSARQEDAVAWRRAMDLGDATPVGSAVIALTSDHLTRQARLEDLGAMMPSHVDVPSPDGATAEEYAARIGVTAIDGWQDAGTIHVFHACRDDLYLVQQLMTAGIQRLGQLRTWLAGATALPLLGHDMVDGLRARNVAVQAWVDAWREGRGRPIDLYGLEASGAVTKKFLDELAAIADEAQGDAQAVLDAIDNKEVKGFRANKRDELETYFEDEGYLDPSSPIKPAERVARMAEALERAGMWLDGYLLTDLDTWLSLGVVKVK